MENTVTPQYRVLLVGRALCLGTLWGLVFGEAAGGALCFWGALSEPVDLGTFVVVLVLFGLLAGIVGAAVGAILGLSAGLALALSEPRVLQRMWRARLVTGSIVAAVPMAFTWNLDRPRPLADYLIAAALATVSAVPAVLLTPRIINGPPPRQGKRVLTPRPPSQALPPERRPRRSHKPRLHCFPLSGRSRSTGTAEA
jgi:hypothetical protein